MKWVKVVILVRACAYIHMWVGHKESDLLSLSNAISRTNNITRKKGEFGSNLCIPSIIDFYLKMKQFNRQKIHLDITSLRMVDCVHY